MSDPQNFELLGHTLDDACGECFDKVAKMLGLPYPGGPAIEKLASSFDASKSVLKFPIPHIPAHQFSFSGLKTAVYYYVKKNPKFDILEICYAFQEAALRQIVAKIKTFEEKFHPVLKSVIIAGGVSANQRFQSHFKEAISIPMIFPLVKYCTDNAAMVASNAYFTATETPPNWDVFPRYPFEKYMKSTP